MKLSAAGQQRVCERGEGALLPGGGGGCDVDAGDAGAGPLPEGQDGPRLRRHVEHEREHAAQAARGLPHTAGMSNFPWLQSRLLDMNFCFPS